jgi:putative two-component system response regulator
MQKEIIQNSRILIVDDQVENVLLLEQALRGAGYGNLESATDSRKVLAAFTRFEPDLVALDLRMPHLDGYALLKEFRSVVPAGTFVPVLVLTADNSRKAKQEALGLGAKDFLTKPIDVAEALLRIYNLLETRWLHVELQKYSETLEEKVRIRTEELEQAQFEILRRLALAAEFRDDCTGQHTERVGALAAELGRSIGLAAQHVDLLRMAAPLHDIGKIGIPDGILLKPGKLTDDEYIQIKKHVEIGRTILSGSRFPILNMAERIALYHHERWDGKGYLGLKGDAIPIEARIVSLVDTFDVITNARPYKQASSVEVATDAIRKEKGAQFDPDLVDAFLSLGRSRSITKLSEALGNPEEHAALSTSLEQFQPGLSWK